MVDKIKMAAKHEFSIVQSISIFIQVNRNLGFEKKVLKKERKTFFFFKTSTWRIKSRWRQQPLFFLLALTQSFLNLF
jgi:hypothetical protein